MAPGLFPFFDDSEKPRLGRGDAWALLALAVFVLCLFGGNLFTGTYPVDPFRVELARTHFPVKTFYAQVIHSGKFPTWSPELATGYPFLAHSHGSFYYPPTWVYYFFPFVPAMTAYIIFHLLALGIGGYLLMRTWGARPAGSLGGAASLVLGGYAFSNMGFLSLSSTFTWTPLAILATTKLLREVRLLWILALALVTLLQSLAGDMEMFFYQWVYLLLAVGLVYTFGRERWRGGFRPFIALMASGLIGILCVIIQYLPLVELFSLSDREGGWQATSIKGNFLSTSLFHIINILKPLFPVGMKGQYEHLGFVATAFGIVGWWRLERRAKWVIGILFLFCLLNSSQHLSPFRGVISYFPVVGSFRFPMRLLFLLQLTACLVAAWGIDMLLESHEDARVPAWLPLGLVAYGLVAFTIGKSMLSGGLILTLAAISGLARVFKLSVRDRKWAFGFILAILIANPVITSVQSLPRNPSYIMEAYPAMKRLFKDNKHPPHAYSRSVIIAHEPNGRFVSGMEVAWGGFTAAFPYSVAYQRYNWYFSLMVPSAIEFDETYTRIKRIRPFFFNLLFHQDEYIEPDSLTWFDLVGVRYIFTRGHELKFIRDQIEAGERFERIYSGEVDIYENKKSYPHAFLATGIKSFPNFRDVFRFMRSNPSFDYRHTVLLESPYGDYTDSPPIPDDGHLPEITSFECDRVEISADPSSPAYLVFTDVYAPGWRAMVNGEEARIMPADGAFRAVKVPSGPTKVEFVYHPIAFRVGLWFSLASMFVGIIMIFDLRFMSRLKRD